MAALRLFIAIDLSPEVKALLAALKTDIAGAVWVKPAVMHLTLRFLGDGIDESRVPAIIAALDAINAPPFALAVRGVGRFPAGDRKPARALWAGLSESTALQQLAAVVETAVIALGFAAELRTFAPHLTLARLKSEAGSAQAAQFLAQHAALQSAQFRVEEFCLFASQLSPQGPIYTRLARFPLSG